MKVTVFTTQTCGYCRALKAWLKDKDIDFTEYRVDTNPKAAQYMVYLSGQMGVPFTTIEKNDGKTIGILGFDRQQLEIELAS